MHNQLDSLSETLQELSTNSAAQSEAALPATLEAPIIRMSHQIEAIQDNLGRAQRRKILQWLSTIPYKRHHQESCEELLPNSGAWLRQRVEFVHWKNCSFSSILWLHGIPGSGKTKLTSSVIQSILNEQSRDSSSNAIAYFYCARTAPEPQRAEPEEVLRALVKQLMAYSLDQPIQKQVVDEFVRREEESDENGGDPMKLKIADCVKLILGFTETKPAVILIDALDECDPAKRLNLVRALEDILAQSNSVVKIFVSSRDDEDIAFRLENSPNIYIKASDNKPDIVRFVREQVAASIDRKLLLNGQVSDQLKDRIVSTLISQAQGMYVKPSYHSPRYYG
jgi:hypothetical protein